MNNNTIKSFILGLLLVSIFTSCSKEVVNPVATELDFVTITSTNTSFSGTPIIFTAVFNSDSVIPSQISWHSKYATQLSHSSDTITLNISSDTVKYSWNNIEDLDLNKLDTVYVSYGTHESNRIIISMANKAPVLVGATMNGIPVLFNSKTNLSVRMHLNVSIDADLQIDMSDAEDNPVFFIKGFSDTLATPDSAISTFHEYSMLNGTYAGIWNFETSNPLETEYAGFIRLQDKMGAYRDYNLDIIIYNEKGSVWLPSTHATPEVLKVSKISKTGIPLFYIGGRYYDGIDKHKGFQNISTIALNSTTQELWVADMNALYVYDDDGTLIDDISSSTLSNVEAICTYGKNTLYVSDNGRLKKTSRGLNSYSNPVDISGLPKFNEIQAIAANNVINDLWFIANSESVYHVKDGIIIDSMTHDSLSAPQSISTVPNKGYYWVSDESSVYKVDIKTDNVLARIFGFVNPSAISTNTTTGDCWVAETGQNRIVLIKSTIPNSSTTNVNTTSTYITKILEAQGQAFSSPQAIAVNSPDKTVWIGDTHSDRIVKLSTTGAVLLVVNVAEVEIENPLDIVTSLGE